MRWRNVGRLMGGFVVGLVGVGMVAGAAFPGSVPGTEIGGGLLAGYEPSGAAWNPTTNQLFVCSDGGAISRLNADGGATTNWSLAGDWEGIAVADPASSRVFVVNESTAIVREFDVASGTALRTFNLASAGADTGVTPLGAADLDALQDGGDGSGAEALVFVPIGGAPEGGEFYVGSQENGTIYRFRLSLSGGTTVVYLGKFKTWPAGNNDLAGLEYDWAHGRIVAIWDTQNTLRTMTPGGTILGEWEVPAGSNDEEGVAVAGASLFVTEDPAPASEVWRYDDVRLGDGARLWSY